MILRRKRKNIFAVIFLNEIIVALVGFVIIVLISIPLSKKVSQRYKINKEIKELQAEVESLENKNKNLDEMIAYLESDQFAEEQARLKLGLRKEGELVAVVEDTEEKQTDTENAQNTYGIPGLDKPAEEKKTSNIVKWFEYFFADK